MRSLSKALSPLTLAALAGAFVACTPTQTTTTTTTAAEIVRSSDMPATRQTADVAGSSGELTCKTHSLADGKAALYLDWKGSSARGTLRRDAPSGMVTVQNVRAERYKDVVIADDTLSQDLVVHAAELRSHKGKKYIRLGEQKSAWLACE